MQREKPFSVQLG